MKDRGYRQVWRFEHAGKGYYLKFYPARRRRDAEAAASRQPGDARVHRGSNGCRRRSVPRPRAVAVLMGFKIDDRLGDAVLLEAIEPSVQLDQYLDQLAARAASRCRTICELAAQSARARADSWAGEARALRPASGQLSAARRTSCTCSTVTPSAATGCGGATCCNSATAPPATRRTTDLLRGWDCLGDGGPLPRSNPVSAGSGGNSSSEPRGGNRYFGKLDSRGLERRASSADSNTPTAGRAASRLEITADRLAARVARRCSRQIEADALEVMKRSRSGDVLAAEIVLAGKPMSVIVKRPRRRYWYRYLNEIGRGSRARRAWIKAWNLIVRNIPTAWPLLLMEKRQLGYVTDAVIIFERVPGQDAAASSTWTRWRRRDRDMLFRRAGRMLRQDRAVRVLPLRRQGEQLDRRSTTKTGPQPVLVDVDGIRRRRWIALGIQRLLRSMQEHPQYTPQDSLALCQGYARTRDSQRRRR